MPWDSFQNLKLMAFNVQAKEVYVRSSIGKKDGVKREALHCN